MTNIRLQCKECDVWFPRLAWMKNTNCDNPNCKCPEVKKLRDQANQVINKAMESSRVNVVNINRSFIDPTGYEEQTPQYMVDTPDVMVIDVIVPKQFRGKKK